MADYETYRGYTVNLPGGKPSWGARENQMFKDLIGKLPDKTKYLTTQHLHTKLFAPDNDSAAGTEVVTVSSDDYVGVGTTTPMGKVDTKYAIPNSQAADKGMMFSIGRVTAAIGTFVPDYTTSRNVFLSDAGTLTNNGILEMIDTTNSTRPNNNSEAVTGFGCICWGVGTSESAFFRFAGGGGGTGTVTAISATANFLVADAGVGMAVYYGAGSNRQIAIKNRTGNTKKIAYWVWYNTCNLS